VSVAGPECEARHPDKLRFSASSCSDAASPLDSAENRETSRPCVGSCRRLHCQKFVDMRRRIWPSCFIKFSMDWKGEAMKMIIVAVLLIGAAAVAIPQSASAERRTRYHECTPGGKCRYVSGGLRFRSPGVKISKRKQTQ